MYQISICALLYIFDDWEKMQLMYLECFYFECFFQCCYCLSNSESESPTEEGLNMTKPAVVSHMGYVCVYSVCEYFTMFCRAGLPTDMQTVCR